MLALWVVWEMSTQPVRLPASQGTSTNAARFGGDALSALLFGQPGHQLPMEVVQSSTAAAAAATSEETKRLIEADVLPAVAIEAFADALRGTGVEQVCWRQEGKEIKVWSILNEHNLELQARVYTAESALLDQYTDLLFDFVILFRHGRPATDLQPANSIVVVL
jgi:hypothetical protein